MRAARLGDHLMKMVMRTMKKKATMTRSSRSSI